MSDHIDSKSPASDAIQHEKGISHVEDSYNLDNEAKLSSYKAAAMEAETAEQRSGVIQAVKEYPMAALWAFIMSCTIVRRLSTTLQGELLLTPCSDHGGLLCLPHGQLHRTA